MVPLTLKRIFKKWSIHLIIIDAAAQVDNVALWLLYLFKEVNLLSFINYHI